MGRPLVRVNAPLKKPRADIPPQTGLDVDPETAWTDAGYLVRQMVEELRTTYYGGDSLPHAVTGISVGHSLYFGCQPHFAET